MRVGSLFAGIGGFDLAAESLGWSTAWVSETDEFASATLARHFPDAPNLGDITAIDWSTVERPDILCGGFPCQPHSLAGKRGSHDDDRDLWPECVRAIRDLRPRYAVFENVPGLLTSDYAEEVGGRLTAIPSGFFGRVLRDLAEVGYDAEWGVFSAADCGAPHKRERVWIVATPARRDPVGDPAHLGRERLRAGGEQELRPYAGSGLPLRPSARLPDWTDATAVRGADGTVRLVPAEAVAGAEPEVRPLADGVPDQLLGRGSGEQEVRAWPTQRVSDVTGGPRTLNEKGQRVSGGQTFGANLADASLAFGAGGPLWPVTVNEVGRAAKLRACGNAVVPRWVVNGPFRRILELEIGGSDDTR